MIARRNDRRTGLATRRSEDPAPAHGIDACSAIINHDGATKTDPAPHNLPEENQCFK
jgi:hypothetical protein